MSLSLLSIFGTSCCSCIHIICYNMTSTIYDPFCSCIIIETYLADRAAITFVQNKPRLQTGHVVEKVIGNMTRPASWLSKLFTSNTVNRVRVLINGEINQLISRCCSCAGLWICCRFCLCSSCSAEGGSLEESDLEGGSCEVTR